MPQFKNIQTISVLGCGWLGLPLAKKLVSQQYLVKGSTTTVEKLNHLQTLNIQPYLLYLNPKPAHENIASFFETDCLVINIPPKISSLGENFHLQQIDWVIEKIIQYHVRNIIFISSTSIYPDSGEVVYESDIKHISDAYNQTLYLAEQKILTLNQCNALVLRCAGLTGYDRILVKHFAGKKNLEGGNHPINMVHRDDVIGVLIESIKNIQSLKSEVLNVCAPQHPCRKEFYSKMAHDFHYTVPEFLDTDSKQFKIVSTDKLIKKLGYTYQYPDPLQFYYL
jgi:nucleoside-diphosphate-sugar epimerase